MLSNSRNDIIARLQGPSTRGWGAISVFSRARLNRALEQQYLSRLETLTFLPPCSLEFQEADKRIALVMIEFGTPRLSFETASFEDSQASLTLNIIGGQVLEYGGTGELLARYELSESMGYTLEMAIELTQVQGIVDQRGRVVLDLSQGTRLASNLYEGELAKALNTRLGSWFAGLPRSRTLFDLGIIDLQGVSPLTPDRFIIRTQAAPGAQLLGANNYGAGAVVVFIKLLGNEATGLEPDREFPYLIPDDDDGERYSASLLVQREMLEHVTGGRLDVLSSLLFPGGQVFQEIDRASPRDLIVFGDIAPHRSLLTLSPATRTLQAGETVQFTLYDANGARLQATRWTAMSLRSHQREADGMFVSGRPGLYQAADVEAIGQNSLTVVITAVHEQGGVLRKASARLLVQHQPVAFAPALYKTVGSLEPVRLNASRTDDNALSWRLLGPALGTLLPEARQAKFEPAAGITHDVALQQIAVDAEGKQRLGVVLNNSYQPARINSSEQGVIKPGQQRTFMHDDATWLPSAERRWRALGDGVLDAQGQYTAPTGLLAATDVVALAFIQNGVSYPGGHAVVTVSSLEPEKSWTDLDIFQVTLSSGVGGTHEGRAFANGYQQLQLDIKVKPVQPVSGDKVYWLSPTEIASIRLRDRRSGLDIDLLDEEAEGIESGSTSLYATRTTPNRFRMSQGGQGHTPLAAADEGVTFKTLYLHARYENAPSAEFSLVLDKDGGGQFVSTEKPVDNASFTFKHIPRPIFKEDHYSIARWRAEGGSAAPGDPVEDNFDFHLRTQDYFILEYGQGIFETCKFYWLDGYAKDLLVTPPCSLLTWESSYNNEVMASYTGWIFRDRLEKKEGGGPPPLEIKYDSRLKPYVEKVIGDFDQTVKLTGFKDGALVIVNFRHDEFPFNKQALAVVNKDLGVELVDQDGNAHYLRLSYGQPTQIGRRNQVALKVEQPPQSVMQGNSRGAV
ncbi:hypothetical protein K4A76_16880 [Pseudomonas sp. NEEL19]|uniref:hypothetical protein n=1 Tax=Pseudomonas sp. NEEL19 TaxID=2867409 RepID=UPI002368D605|nr:hypothetical protein [Pseudomonas sp. NEEL19]WDM58124.1 hypothetical protein K4A76_16880 [Pseudomonas sp. NEEL19]